MLLCLYQTMVREYHLMTLREYLSHSIQKSNGKAYRLRPGRGMECVTDHEGYIDVKSDKNGTIFELYFPVTRDEISDEESPGSVEDYRGDDR